MQHTHTYTHTYIRHGRGYDGTKNRPFQIDEYRLKLIDTALELNVRLLKAHRRGPGFDHNTGHVGFALGKM